MGYGHSVWLVVRVDRTNDNDAHWNLSRASVCKYNKAVGEQRELKKTEYTVYISETAHDRVYTWTAVWLAIVMHGARNSRAAGPIAAKLMLACPTELLAIQEARCPLSSLSLPHVTQLQLSQVSV